MSANFKCQVHILQQLPFFSRAGTRRLWVPSIQAQAGNTVSHLLTIKLQKKCFAPKSSRWDPTRKGETQGGCRSTVAGLSATCASQNPDAPQWTSDNRGDVSDHSRLPWRQVQGGRGGPARAPGGQRTQMPMCREVARPKSSQPIFLSVGMGGERWNSTDLLGRLPNLKMWEP